VKRLWLAVLLCFAALPAAAQDIREVNDYGGMSFSLSGRAAQGGLLVGKTKPHSTVMADGRPVRVAGNGAFLIAFPFNHNKTFVEIVVRSPDQSSTEARSFPVLPRVFDVQRIDGLPERTVEPLPEDLKKIQEEQRLIREARAPQRDAADFESGFIWPAEGVITGVYGSQRVLNGQPRAPHLGVDIAAGRGTPIRAAAAGMVALAHKDLFLNGNVVILDHGLGLTSVYIHLDEIKVKKGQRVGQGEQIGTMGRTGRATGVNLHWGVNLGDIGLDPQLLVGPMVQR
jgi:murein DD-endopeptidase MepM/ murein hydrolase activator NlpD